MYAEGYLYHAYNRGVNKQVIFNDAADYAYFLSLMKRHLSQKVAQDKKGRLIPNYSKQVELVAFCLMPNHYHLLLYLKEKEGIEKLMRSAMTSYSRYFNTKYKRVGPLFQSNFLASPIFSEPYFWHISRYIHLNPLDIKRPWRSYPYSSLRYFTYEARAEWIHPEHIVEYPESAKYLEFVADYEDAKEVLDLVKEELASAN